MKTYLTVLTASIGLLFLASTAPASPLLSSSGGGFTSVATPDAVIGFNFTIGAISLEASALGLFDQDLDGFSEAHDVSIWTSAGTLLGSVTIPSGNLTPLMGEFRYVPLNASVTLIAGQTYVVAATYPSQADWFIADSPDQANAVFSPYASFGVSASRVGSGFPFLGGTDLYTGPNIEITPIPEPSSLVLVVSGTLMILAFRNTLPKSMLTVSVSGSTF